ncbi:MAG: MarC family protein [Candidatus Nanopelagicales bacterium]
MGALIDMRVFGSALVTIFVIMDPPGIVPIFMALAQGKTREQRAHIARTATATSLGVIVAFALLGEQVLQYLKISLPALQGAGGLLLLLIALQLLTGAEQTQNEAVNDVSVALVPLGTPLLAGPGAIVATILYSRQADTAPKWVALAAAVLAVHIMIWIAMRFSGFIARLAGTGGIMVFSRIMGLLLAAIGVQLLANSVEGFIGLAH